MSEQPFPRLRSPLQLSESVRLANRLVFQPHYTALGTRDGMPSGAHAAYHGARSRGGAGLNIMESQAVHPTGKMNPHFVHAWDPRTVSGYRAVAAAVHEHGGRILSQLTHGGHTTGMNPPRGLWAPTQLPEPSATWSTKAIDQEDIDALVRGFVAGANNAIEGDFDGVEVKIAHDGLLRTFISPYFNHRTDSYGGSFANRMRLPSEVLSAVRDSIGSGPALGVRLCLSEFTDWGYGLDHGLEIAAHLEELGVLDYFNCDHGSWSSTWYEIPPEAIPEGSFRPLNRGLNAQSKLPVIASGRIRRPELAEEILEAGEADLIGMARQLIADPDVMAKITDDRTDEIRLCIACNATCVGQTNQDQPIGCAVNPAAGREHSLTDFPQAPARQGRKVLVVGGGPAGMEAAITIARAGHRVTLAERTAQLGGLILLAASQPLHDQVGDSVAHQALMLERLGVEVLLETEMDVAGVFALAPEAVVVATGSEPNLPTRPHRSADSGDLARALGRQIEPRLWWTDSDRVISADECYDANGPSNGRVVIVDESGDWEGVGTAELLADRGCMVTVISAEPRIAARLDPANVALWHRRAIEKHVTLLPNHETLAVGTDDVRTRDLLSGNESAVAADCVVAVTGRRSCEDLFLSLSRAAPSCVRLARAGDCVSPRRLEQAIHEGHDVACEILAALAGQPVAA